MAVLLVCATEGPTITLDKPIVLVGRHPDCDVQLDSPKVSRRHCCVAQVDGDIVVRDLGSTNGIRINGEVVQECRPKVGDELAIGNVRFRIEQDQNKPTNSQVAGARERLRRLRAEPDPKSSDVPIVLPDDEDVDDDRARLRTLKPDDDDGLSPSRPSSDEVQFAPSDHGSNGSSAG